MTETALVVVATFLSAADAEVARTALEAGGVEFTSRSDDCGGLRPPLTAAVELLVRADDAERAREILADTRDQTLGPAARDEPGAGDA